MLMFRRWWQRHGFSVIFVGVGLSAALFLRQTQGGVIQEFFALLANRDDATEAKQETELLLLQNSKLRELQNRIEDLEQQNLQLQEILGYSQTVGVEAIAAPVIGRSADSWWQQVTIGQGSNAGIKEGFVVTGTGGLVGRVTKVTPHSSRVMLVSDANQQIGVMVARSRHQGFLKGLSDPKLANMTFYEKVPDVKEGDQILTSNLSVFYPQGIPVGRVVSIDRNNGPAPIAKIELSAPLNILEWVNVMAFEMKSLDIEMSPDQNVEEDP
jgi:rod shape-determining protein MreC